MQNALEIIIRDNLLTGIALESYEILFYNPDLTIGEIWRRYKTRNPKSPRSRNEIAKRVRDLEVWGAIERSGNRSCEVTGRYVNTYKITGNPPDKKQINPDMVVTRQTNRSTTVDHLQKMVTEDGIDSVRQNLVKMSNDFYTQSGKWWRSKKNKQKLLSQMRICDDAIKLLGNIETELELTEI